MAAPNITSADALITLSVDTIYPLPQILSGFSTNDIYGVDSVAVAESMMGVDGKLSAGMVNSPVIQTFHFQADALDSIAIFENVYLAQRQNRTVYPFTGLTILKANTRQFQCTKGYLTTWNPIPSAGKTLAPRVAVIVWESVQPSPAGT